MSFKDDIRDAVREVLREELAKFAKPAANEYLTPEEAAAVVRREPDTVRTWCASGKLRARKLHGGWLIKRTDLEIFIEREGADQPTPSPQEAALAAIASLEARRKAK